MNDDMYSDIKVERACKEFFGLKLDISEVIARDIPTSYTSNAVVFKTSPNVVYIYISSQSKLLLADVKKMVRSMNIDAEKYMPPHGDDDYFKRIGTEKFKAMFPGKHIMSEADTRYYQTLAPYNPALVRVMRIKGDIRGFHFESQSWRKVKDYAFNKISLK